MEVELRNPRRTVEVAGPMTVRELMDHLGLVTEAHLVVRADALVMGDERLGPDDRVEIRPVISGG